MSASYEEELNNKDNYISKVNQDNNIDNNNYTQHEYKEENIPESIEELINEASIEVKLDNDEVNYNEDININEDVIVPLVEVDPIIKEPSIKENNINDVVKITNPKMKKNAKTIEYIEDGDYSQKAWSVTLILCILLGFIGLHRFYVGKAGTAILMLFTFGGFGIWILVDLIRIIINNFTDEEGKIVKRNALAN